MSRREKETYAVGIYTVEIDWFYYPTVKVKRGDVLVGERDYMITGWFLIRPRIYRWARRTIHKSERLAVRFALLDTQRKGNVDEA